MIGNLLKAYVKYLEEKNVSTLSEAYRAAVMFLSIAALLLSIYSGLLALLSQWTFEQVGSPLPVGFWSLFLLIGIATLFGVPVFISGTATVTIYFLLNKAGIVLPFPAWLAWGILAVLLWAVKGAVNMSAPSKDDK